MACMALEVDAMKELVEKSPGPSWKQRSREGAQQTRNLDNKPSFSSNRSPGFIPSPEGTGTLDV